RRSLWQQPLRDLPARLHPHDRGGFAPAHALLSARVLRGRRLSGMRHPSTRPGPSDGNRRVLRDLRSLRHESLRDQLFVLRPDGALRQLTQARGLVTEVDGTVSAANIGPVAYSSLFATVGR